MNGKLYLLTTLFLRFRYNPETLQFISTVVFDMPMHEILGLRVELLLATLGHRTDLRSGSSKTVRRIVVGVVKPGTLRSTGNGGDISVSRAGCVVLRYWWG